MHIHRTNAQEIWKRAIAARRLNQGRGHATPLRGWRRMRFKSWAYFAKMKGMHIEGPEIYPLEILWSFVGSFLGIGILSWCNYTLLGRTDQVLLLGTFGASAMLLFGAPQVPFAQPRNVLGGHVISAFCGIACAAVFGADSPLAAPAAVATSIAAMHASCTLHPPGGGTALLMVTGGPEITALGFTAILFPVASGAAVLIITALLINNLSRRRRYPISWW